MRELNEAFDAAVGHLTGRRRLEAASKPDDGFEPEPAARTPEPPSRATPPQRPRWVGRVQQDVPSFVIDALPAEAFEALLVVTSWIGEVLVDDPARCSDTALRPGFRGARYCPDLFFPPDLSATLGDGASRHVPDALRDIAIYTRPSIRWPAYAAVLPGVRSRLSRHDLSMD